MAEVIQAWARLPGPQSSESLNNWNWFFDWFSRNIFLEVAIVALLCIGSCLLIVGAIRNGPGAFTIRAFLIPAFAAIFGVVFWFFSAPDPRFASGFLFSLGLLLSYSGNPIFASDAFYYKKRSD